MRSNLVPTRLFSMLLAVLTVGALLVPNLPTAQAEPPARLGGYVTDSAGVLDPGALADVKAAVDDLYTARRVRLWVVYVDTFSGQTGTAWAQRAMQINNFQPDQDALLAVATQDRDYALLAGTAIMSNSDQATLRRDEVEPALRQGDWAGAATAAATGLKNDGSSTGSVSWVGIAIFLTIIALAVLALIVWQGRRRRKRREAEFAAAKRVDPADPNALSSLSLDALEDLSKSIVVEVDNAVRTSDNELTLAIEEFGERDTAPFTKAVDAAKTALTQAFNVRQILDDTIPETPQQRRDLLTRVIVAAARADDELEAQREAFGKLRDLVINAPDRLDTFTQQMVDLSARIEPAERTLAALHSQFSETALASVAGNVETAKQRLSFADQSISQARALVAKPAGSQGGLVDAVRSAESALGQARMLLDAVDSASTDINRAVAALPAAIADIQNGITAASAHLARGGVPRADELSTARDSAVAHAQSAGTSDPLGTFTQLTQADATLDRLLAAISDEVEAEARLNRAFDQALFSAQSQVRSVSRTSSTPAAAASDRRPAPGWRRPCGNCRRPRRSRRPTSRRQFSTPTAPRCSPPKPSRWPTPTSVRPSGSTPGATAVAGLAEAVAAMPARSSAASSSATSSPARSAAGSEEVAAVAAGARARSAVPVATGEVAAGGSDSRERACWYGDTP